MRPVVGQRGIDLRFGYMWVLGYHFGGRHAHTLYPVIDMLYLDARAREPSLPTAHAGCLYYKIRQGGSGSTAAESDVLIL